MKLLVPLFAVLILSCRSSHIPFGMRIKYRVMDKHVDNIYEVSIAMNGSIDTITVGTRFFEYIKNYDQIVSSIDHDTIRVNNVGSEITLSHNRNMLIKVEAYQGVKLFNGEYIPDAAYYVLETNVGLYVFDLKNSVSCSYPSNLKFSSISRKQNEVIFFDESENKYFKYYRCKDSIQMLAENRFNRSRIYPVVGEYYLVNWLVGGASNNIYLINNSNKESVLLFSGALIGIESVEILND